MTGWAPVTSVQLVKYQHDYGVEPAEEKPRPTLASKLKQHKDVEEFLKENR